MYSNVHTKSFVFLYTINFIQHWMQLKQSGRGPWPEGRVGHAACCLNYGQQYPQLLVYGGGKREGRPLEDVWILDVKRGK